MMANRLSFQRTTLHTAHLFVFIPHPRKKVSRKARKEAPPELPVSPPSLVMPAVTL